MNAAKSYWKYTTWSQIALIISAGRLRDATAFTGNPDKIILTNDIMYPYSGEKVVACHQHTFIHVIYIRGKIEGASRPPLDLSALAAKAPENTHPITNTFD
jgi:hypothetical protein